MRIGYLCSKSNLRRCSFPLIQCPNPPFPPPRLNKPIHEGEMSLTMEQDILASLSTSMLNQNSLGQEIEEQNEDEDDDDENEEIDERMKNDDPKSDDDVKKARFPRSPKSPRSPKTPKSPTSRIGGRQKSSQNLSTLSSKGSNSPTTGSNSTSNLAFAQKKLSELFLTWISQKSTTQSLKDFVDTLSIQNPTSEQQKMLQKQEKLKEEEEKFAKRKNEIKNNKNDEKSSKSSEDEAENEKEDSFSEIEPVKNENEDDSVSSSSSEELKDKNDKKNDKRSSKSSKSEKENNSSSSSSSKKSENESEENLLFPRKRKDSTDLVYAPEDENNENLEEKTEEFLKEEENFRKIFDNKELNLQEFISFGSKFLKLPFFLCKFLFRMIITKESRKERLSFQKFKKFWFPFSKKSKKLQYFLILKHDDQDENLKSENLKDVIQEIVMTHPSLHFLKETPPFQKKYCFLFLFFIFFLPQTHCSKTAETVLIRIFYAIKTKSAGKITFSEFGQRAHNNSSNLNTNSRNFSENLVSALEFLGNPESDINSERKFFSYEHFYVLYCKFWELDKNHDFLITEKDLKNYENGTLSDRIVKRVFDGYGKETQNSSSSPKNESKKPDSKKTEDGRMMNYEDFIWFCISEIDKSSTRAVEYWFKCLDLQMDGFLTPDEIQYFFEEQEMKMKKNSKDSVSFGEILQQIYDMIHPAEPAKGISMRDLKKSRISNVFFDICFNYQKFLEFEQKGLTLWQQQQLQKKENPVESNNNNNLMDFFSEILEKSYKQMTEEEK